MISLFFKQVIITPVFRVPWSKPAAVHLLLVEIFYSVCHFSLLLCWPSVVFSDHSMQYASKTTKVIKQSSYKTFIIHVYVTHYMLCWWRSVSLPKFRSYCALGCQGHSFLLMPRIMNVSTNVTGQRMCVSVISTPSSYILQTHSKLTITFSGNHIFKITQLLFCKQIYS